MKDMIKNVTDALEGKVADNYKVAGIPESIKKNKKIAIITGDETEDLEFFYPYYRFNEEGYEVDVITLGGGEFKGKRGIGLKESKSIDSAITDVDEYQLIYLPGGKAPQKLREDEMVLKFIHDFYNLGKPIAAICHGPQILISAGLVGGKKIAAWPQIKEEVTQAGAIFTDEAVVDDGQFITARKPADLPLHLHGVLKKLRENSADYISSR